MHIKRKKRRNTSCIEREYMYHVIVINKKAMQGNPSLYVILNFWQELFKREK